MAENLVYKRITTAEIAQLALDEKVSHYAEHSFYWLEATIKYLMNPKDEVSWHCLVRKSDSALCIALPLVKHQQFGLCSYQNVFSCYANSMSPLCYEDEMSVLFTDLIQAIKENTGCDKIRLGPLTQGDSWHRKVTVLPSLNTIFAQSDNWYTKQLVSIEEYLRARPSQLKNTIKRRIKKLDRENDWNIEYATDVESFQALFQDYKDIYQNSWKGNEYSYAFIESVCLSALTRNQLRLAVLYIDGKPAAAQIWFVVNKRASIFKLAYDPCYQSLSVGSILTMDLFTTVIEQDAVVEVEYGTGNEPYKKDWVDQLRQRVIIDIYNEHTLRGKLLFLVKRFKQRFVEK